MFEFFADFIVYNLLQLSEGEPFTKALHFFIYDVFKIYILIITVIFVIGFFQTFIPLEKVKTLLQKKSFGLGHFFAAVLGALSPFCSCSSIPLFIGFLRARMPLGKAFAFLTTSPLVNEVVFVMMGGFFGWKFAFLYAGIGIALGVLTGLLIDALQLEKEILISEEQASNDMLNKSMPTTFTGKFNYAKNESFKTLKKLWWIILIGVGVGAILHGYVPQEFFMNTVGKYETWSVPLAVLLGIPIYAGGSMVVPVIFSITANGIPLGTSLAFLMSIAGLSLPEAIMLRRVISTKLLVIFFSLVSIGIIFIGFFFNLFR